MIEIYGKTFCPYCDKAKNLCEREGLDIPINNWIQIFLEMNSLIYFQQQELFLKLKLMVMMLVVTQS